jgi:site-specific DNA-methyltransferase (adenine-specific)
MSPMTTSTARPANEIVNGDCLEVLKAVDANYFSACITDPPYNYEFVGRAWDDDEINRRLERVKDSKTLVKNLPYGSGLAGGVRNERWYSRIRENIVEYEDWCRAWATEVYRTLRPGAFALVFNSTRTISHVQCALEDVGFYARDILVYRRHAGIPKGLNAKKKFSAVNGQNWDGWHSCLRNEWEAIAVVQKPLIRNYENTLEKSGVGLFKAIEEDGTGFLSNIIEGIRPKQGDRIDAHCTVKPLELMEKLVKMVVPSSSEHIVLDPFAGTGTTCLAARNLNINFWGVEINSKYAEIAKRRLQVHQQTAQADADQHENRIPGQGATRQNSLPF